MKNLIVFSHKIIAFCMLLVSGFAFAQSSYSETFQVNPDVLVEVNTSHTDVVFETWNKNTVEIQAVIEGEDLSEEEKKKIFENWDYEVLGSKKKVVITSNEGSLWGGFESLGNLSKLEELKHLESLQGMAALESLKALEGLGDMNLDFNIVIPDMPNMEKFPNWPFSNDRPSMYDGDGSYSFFVDKGANKFNEEEYERNKQSYVDKLNKKYNTNVSVSEVDSWLNSVDVWAEEFEKVMDDWGEEFGTTMENKFGPEFEAKMEKWGEEFGKSMEKWGEEFGEKFGKDMEKWGEEFGKDMEKWGAEFEKNAEKWAEQFEDDGIFSKQEITDKHGNKKTIIRGSKSGNSLFPNAKKKIIIKMPKGGKTDVNVRHGKLKMADVYNLKATLNYASLVANSIDGGQTLINAAYAPVSVNDWIEGTLYLKYVEDCKINKVGKIDLLASTSNISINKIDESASLSGSFGNLFIREISPSFETVDIVLENTDATLSVPNSDFLFDYHGKRSRFTSPASIVLTTKDKKEQESKLKGYHKSKNSKKSITITAAYSNINME